MTESTLRDLLRERVADETVPDLSHAAWAAGARLRRRRHAFVAGGAAALVLGVVGGAAAVLARDPQQVSPAPPVSSTRTTPPPQEPATVSHTPDARVDGVPIWWAPDQDADATLPRLDSQLPADIDLDTAYGPVRRAVAAFARGSSVLLEGVDGGQMSLDVAFLDDVRRPDGTVGPPVHPSMLSPTGDYLVFPQQRSVWVFTLRTGQWHEIRTGDRPTRFVTWGSDDSVILPPAPGAVGDVLDVRGRPAGHYGWPTPTPAFPTGDSAPYGRTRTGALGLTQAWGPGASLPGPDGSSRAAGFVAFEGSGGQQSQVLLLPGRSPDCCGVASWISERVVGFEAHGSDPATTRVLGWRLGTDDVRLVTTVHGTYDVASWARLWQDLATAPR
jgi:hypothetical protein